MEDDDLAQHGLDLRLAADEAVEMQIADRTAGKTAELDVGDRATVGQVDRLAGKQADAADGSGLTWSEAGHRAGARRRRSASTAAAMESGNCAMPVASKKRSRGIS